MPTFSLTREARVQQSFAIDADDPVQAIAFIESGAARPAQRMIDADDFTIVNQLGQDVTPPSDPSPERDAPRIFIVSAINRGIGGGTSRLCFYVKTNAFAAANELREQANTTVEIFEAPLL